MELNSQDKDSQSQIIAKAVLASQSLFSSVPEIVQISSISILETRDKSEGNVRDVRHDVRSEVIK